MLCLLFSMDGGLFGLEASSIVEVVPWTPLWKPPCGAPGYIAGCLDYKGRMAPVLDMTALCLKRGSRRALSTRIALTNFPGEGLLGLLLEKATEMADIPAESFKSPPLKLEGAPFLGDLSSGGTSEAVELVKVEELVPPDVRRIVFPGPERDGEAKT